MLDPLPPSSSTPTSIPVVLNFRPYYQELRVSDITSITVEAILKDVWGAADKSIVVSTSMLRLRWITDKSMAFCAQNYDPRVGCDQYAAKWYYAKGHHLASTPIATDATLQEKLRTAIDAPVVRLYAVVTPYEGGRRLRVENEHARYISHYCPSTGLYGGKDRTGDQEESVLTRMAPLYEPAFAHAENALRNTQDARLNELNGLACHDGAADLDYSTFNARLFATQLRDALGNLKSKIGHPVEEGVHAEALGELFRQLFDDPTLKMNVKSSGVDDDPWIELNIEGRCPTAYDVPALYIIGKDRLISPSAAEGAPEAKAPEGMRAYRNAVMTSEYYPVYDSTCCPCLVIGTEGTTVQFYAAYFADRIYRSHICEFTLGGSLPSDEDALKLQVIRSTAQMLRTSYAMVHTGAPLRPVTCLLPRPSIAMPAPLPFHLRIRDHVGLGACIFTGMLNLSPSDPDSEVAVHIKFVDSYGTDAHRLLAAHTGADGVPHPLAPKLYWAAEVTPGGLMMIVMESLPDNARTLLRYQPRPEPDPKDPEFRYWKRLPGPDPVSWDELEDLRTAVSLLHRHDFVHGDIRHQNVMLQRPAAASDGGSGTSRSRSRAYLIDFDRAGKEGEARYHPDLNPDVKWPRPASELSGQPITKLHDLFMLNLLMPSPPPSSLILPFQLPDHLPPSMPTGIPFVVHHTPYYYVPPYMPTHISFVLNHAPYYKLMQVPDTASITVSAILQHACAVMNKDLEMVPSELRLRWITDQNMAFSIQWLPLQSDHGDSEWEGQIQQEAWNWYRTKGHHLASTPVATDAALQERLRGVAKDAVPVVRLYVVGPASRGGWVPHFRIERGEYMFCEPRCAADSEGILTRTAALYEPAFAYAVTALRNVQDVTGKLDGEQCHGDGADLDSDGTPDDARCKFVPRLHDALANLNTGHSEGDSDALALALNKLFQELFDDPTLKVNVTSSEVDGKPCTELDIEGRCPTAYGIPALYIVGKDRLMESGATEGAPGGDTVAPEGMLAYRNIVAKDEYESMYESTCCPCLVVGIAGTTVHLYAAYVANRIYRSHICQFALDSLHHSSHEDAVKTRIQVIRSTAQMLRKSYAMVHTGTPFARPRPHLLPNLGSIIMPALPPFRLDFLDCLHSYSHTALFSGEIKLSTCDDTGTKCKLPVHIKFMEKYGADAHRLLTAHKGADGSPRPLAPKLYWAGKVMPDLTMVVMESLPEDAKTLLWYEPPSPSPECDSKSEDEEDEEGFRDLGSPPAPVSWHELEDVHTAVELLHKHGFVHGDIRPQNVMLQRPAADDSDGEEGTGISASSSARDVRAGAARAYLIDFDWAGKEGEARYSPKLNPDIKWPRPVSELNGQPITKLHDLFMLSVLLPRRDLKHERPDSGHDDNVVNLKRKRVTV